MASRATTRAEVMSLLGDPRVVDKDLKRFRRSSRALSSDRPRLINEHRDRWVAVYKGGVKASEKTFDGLMAAVEKRKLPRESIVVRFIDKDERIMIL